MYNSLRGILARARENDGTRIFYSKTTGKLYKFSSGIAEVKIHCESVIKRYFQYSTTISATNLPSFKHYIIRTDLIDS